LTPLVERFLVANLVADPDDTEGAVFHLPGFGRSRELHEDVVIFELIDLVQNDDANVEASVENLPKTPVAIGRGDTRRRNRHTRLVAVVERLGDRPDCLRLGGILKAIDVCHVDMDAILGGGLSQILRDVL